MHELPGPINNNNNHDDDDDDIMTSVRNLKN